MIYEKPDLIFDATSCGENCSRWLLEIGKKQDVTVNLKYLMHFENSEELRIYIENEKREISGYKDYVMTAVKYV